MGLDWLTFYEAGRAILEGMSPYTVPGYFNPPLLAYLLAPTTMIPFSIWMPLMITVSCFALIVLAKRKSVFLLLSPFILQALTWGSVDLLLTASMSVSWGFLALKPQLLFIALPVILRRLSRRDLIIAGSMLIAYPPHYVDWFRAIQTTKNERIAENSIDWSANLSSLGPVAIIAGLVLAVAVLKMHCTPSSQKLILTALSPLSRVHDYLVAWEELATFKMWAFSWILFVVWYHLETRSELIYVLIGLSVLVRELPYPRKAYVVVKRRLA